MVFYRRHIYYIWYAVALSCVLLATGCTTKQEKQTVSVSIAPIKYFVDAIAGDLVEVNVIVPPGANPETYDPTPREMLALSSSQLYFAMGSLGFESVWLPRIKAQSPSLSCISFVDSLPSVLSHTHDGEESIIHYDPHFWMSIMGAEHIAQVVHRELSQLLPEHIAQVDSAYVCLQKKIEELRYRCKARFAEADATHSFVIFHPTLSYFAEEWGLQQIVIEHEGKEPTPAHLQWVIEQAKQTGTTLVLVQAEFDQKNAQTIASEIGGRIERIAPLSEDWYDEMQHIVSLF